MAGETNRTPEDQIVQPPQQPPPPPRPVKNARRINPGQEEEHHEMAIHYPQPVSARARQRDLLHQFNMCDPDYNANGNNSDRNQHHNKR